MVGLACARGERRVAHDMACCADEIAAADFVAEVRFERCGLERGEAITAGHESLHHHREPNVHQHHDAPPQIRSVKRRSIRLRES